jgi:hypothetical protein
MEPLTRLVTTKEHAFSEKHELDGGFLEALGPPPRKRQRDATCDRNTQECAKATRGQPLTSESSTNCRPRQPLEYALASALTSAAG